MKNKILGLVFLCSSLQVFFFNAGIGFSKSTVKPLPELKYIDISGIDKAALLMEIFNFTNKSSRSTFIEYADAQKIIDETGGIIGRLRGKDLNIDISGDRFYYQACKRVKSVDIAAIVASLTVPAEQAYALGAPVKASLQRQHGRYGDL